MKMKYPRKGLVSAASRAGLFAVALVVACGAANETGTTPVATNLQFDSQLAGGTAGATFPAVAVDVLDADGHIVPTATTTITLTASTGSGILLGTTTASAVTGTAHFADLSIQKSSISSYTLTATAQGLASATSNSFTIINGPLTQVTFVVQPTSAQAGAVLASIRVACTDAFGNLIDLPPGGNISVTIALGTNSTGATLGGTLTVSGVAAVATQFNDLSVDKAGSYTLIAHGNSNGQCATAPQTTSSSFVITP
jgi:hypothetical protein